MRSEFVACPHSFYQRFILDRVRAGRSVHLHFGGAYAAGLKTLRDRYYSQDSGDQEAALAAGAAAIVKFWGAFESPRDSTKTLDRCIGALEAYVAHYPLETDHIKPARARDGTLMTEFSFALPLPILHPLTEQPLLYSGRCDMLASMGGPLYLEDDKTTSQLGPSWATNWHLRAQFTGYTWGARAFDYDVQGVVIRGISILRASYGHAEVIEQRPEWMIDRWYNQLLWDVTRMIQSWRNNEWGQNFDSACAAYGGCPYLDLCAAREPEKWLADYETRPYDPLGKQS
jgi:hypothetical protein